MCRLNLIAKKYAAYQYLHSANHPLDDSLLLSPLQDKTLSRVAENHIVDCAGEYGLDELLRLEVHVPESIKEYAEEITQAIHAHF